MTPALSYTDDMPQTAAERQAAYRRRKGAKERGPLKPCGTTAAAKRHRRKGEPYCDLCLAAIREEYKYFNARRPERAKKAKVKVPQ